MFAVSVSFQHTHVHHMYTHKQVLPNMAEFAFVQLNAHLGWLDKDNDDVGLY